MTFFSMALGALFGGGLADDWLAWLALAVAWPCWRGVNGNSIYGATWARARRETGKNDGFAGQYHFTRSRYR